MGRQHSHTVQPPPLLCPALASLSHPCAEQWEGIHWVPLIRAWAGIQLLGSFLPGTKPLGVCFALLSLHPLAGKVLMLVVLSPAVAFFPCKHPSST